MISKLCRYTGQGMPVLFVGERCSDSWQSMPILPLHRDDLSDFEDKDHAADATGYPAVQVFGAGIGSMKPGLSND